SPETSLLFSSITRNRFSLIDCVSVGVDRMQRNFDPMAKQLAARCELTMTSTVGTEFRKAIRRRVQPLNHPRQSPTDLSFSTYFPVFGSPPATVEVVGDTGCESSEKPESRFGSN